ncbi:D-aminoacylase [Xylanibacillus composti]|uniref:D-aminoacylase n=1 Tax=Xylanibacillus composti TaxID=1572762 RepID=A0A8J4M4E8_9BACL|nr:D-aminoacylase [Xylanibacillus composti]MDT9726341.1 D-aminoacylase [Xylanibacillus composti]GIQ70551.1 D-aminoacylase [Xylanibacillus composti]
MQFDVVIKGGCVIDGTEKERFKADVYVKDGKIVEIAADEKPNVVATEIIDATGKIVSPGFIDTHVHSDIMLLWDRQHANGLYQGVTTEVLGQDGLSYAPLSEANLSMYAKYLAGLNGRPPISWDWSTVAEYRQQFHRTVAINTVYQVPHGALRLETVGMKDVPLTGESMKKAKALLDQGLKEGAAAFSTGLSYYPCSYSDTEEMIELCKTVAENDSVYVTHLRSVFRGEPFDPVLEAIEIAEKSGAKLHFSHFRTTPETAGKVDEVMKHIDAAYQRGVDLTLELYPYPSGSGYAVIFLPPWAVEDGFDATLERLRNQSLRKRMMEGIEANTIECVGHFTHLKKNPQYIGRSFIDVARERGQSVPDMICDILLEEELEVGFFTTPPFDAPDIWEQINKDVLELLSRPYYMVGSDGIPLGKNPHPRAFGTFPRLLRFCREYGFRLETMINRMTKTAADRFGLKDRGTVEVGKAADLVVFDPDSVRDTATYLLSRSAPEGISHVLVNGEVAVRNEKVTGVFAGQALSRQF